MILDLGDKIYLTMTNYWSWWWKVDNEKDELARSLLTISVITLIVFWFKWTSSYSTKSNKPQLPPGPWGLPVVGYLPFLGSNLHERFAEMANRYGPIFRLRLGSKLHVIVNSIELAKVVVRDLDHTFANRDPPVAALAITYGARDIAWSNNNSHWRSLRKLLVSQVMSNKNLEACGGFRRDEVRKTIRDVYAKVGTKIDINEIAFATELNVVTKMLWGCSNDYFGDEFREIEFKIIELIGTPNVSDFIPILARFDLQGFEGEMKRQLEYVDRIFDKIIDERVKVMGDENEGRVDNDGKMDFLQILLELKESKETSTSFDIVHIKALLMDIVVAATDTTSTMAEWVMAEILHKPWVMEKVNDELTQVIGIKNIVEESHLPKLHYLDAVVKETFRLHPPLPLLIQRCPDQDCKIAEYMIPKGTIVYLNVWAIHRDPQNWDSPLEFKPERFLNNNGTNKWDYAGNNLKFLPFGTGRRICPGVSLGEKMLMYIVASLLHSFQWSLPTDKEFDLSDEFGFVTKKRKPLVAIPSQRLSNANLYL